MKTKTAAASDYRTVLGRCLRLRCPACGDGRLFSGWFRNHDSCSNCGYDFVREPGFYLGSIYVNYGLTAVLLVAVCSPIVLLTDTPYSQITPFALLFCVLFPMWFHHYARAIWLGFDYRWDGFRDTQRATIDENQTPIDDQSPTAVSVTCPFCHHRDRYEPAEDKWVECRRCGQRILAT